MFQRAAKMKNLSGKRGVKLIALLIDFTKDSKITQCTTLYTDAKRCKTVGSCLLGKARVKLWHHQSLFCRQEKRRSRNSRLLPAGVSVGMEGRCGVVRFYSVIFPLEAEQNTSVWPQGACSSFTQPSIKLIKVNSCEVTIVLQPACWNSQWNILSTK